MTKKLQESPVKGHNYGFLPLIFSKFKALRTVHPSTRHVFLEFLVENIAFHFLKRALPAGTRRNKWLKKALACLVTVVAERIVKVLNI